MIFLPMQHIHFLSERLISFLPLAYVAAMWYDEFVGWCGMRFEWDEEKAASNLKKHGIDFRDAVRVFQDDYRIEIYDEAHSDTEDRFCTIGMVDDILFVVYTERGDAVRMISARFANRRERSLYYDR